MMSGQQALTSIENPVGSHNSIDIAKVVHKALVQEGSIEEAVQGVRYEHDTDLSRNQCHTQDQMLIEMMLTKTLIHMRSL
jgi:hypothetical protein